jgi:putative lysine transport system permease protein
MNNKSGLNIKVFLLGLLTLFFSWRVIVQELPGISVTYYAKFLFGYFSLLLGASGITLGLYFLIGKPNQTFWLKLRKIIYWILLVYTIIYLLEFIILAIINSSIRVSKLTRIPRKDEFLDSLIYIVFDYADDFLKGVFMTLELSLIGTLLGLVFGLILVVFRTLKINPQDNEIVVFLKKAGIFISKIYINVFRGTPMIVQAVIIYYLLPTLLSSWLEIGIDQIGRVLTITVSGIIIVTLNTTAYLTEVLRGGIEAVDKGQLEAARSLGMSHPKAMIYVVLPQAIKNSLPAICNEFIINIKDTSVLNVIGVAELFFVANEAQFKYYRTYEPFIIVALIYLFLTLTTSKLLGLIERKLNLQARPLPSSN